MFCPSVRYFMRHHSSNNNQYGRMCRISDTEFEQTLKPYQNHRMSPCIYKAVGHTWSFLSLGTNALFFNKFLATHTKLLSEKLELEVTLSLRLSKRPFLLNF